MKHTLLWAAICCLCGTCAMGQTAAPTQQLRGTVTDQFLQTPLSGATVSITGTNFSTITDTAGQFRFSKLPVGTYTLQVSYVGFRNAIAQQLLLISGKELVVNIGLEPATTSEQEVIIKGRSKKNRPVNERSLVSARAFTVEETQRYAAAVNDPLRMATAYAGVVGADDGNNAIVIRGNAPNGLLWRMEGIDIPNPNHFAGTNSSAGGISILSSALLANSDFVTGAWAAEYGNALSGAFDLKLRKGNNQKHEYNLQAGMLGLNAAAEGPLKLGKQRGSYLVNYRYSTLALLGKLGLDIGMGNTDFQDLSYHIHLPAGKAGSFTLFGFAGLSSQRGDAEKDSSKWDNEGDRYGLRFDGTTAFTGATHQIRLSPSTLLKSGIGYSYVKSAFHETYINDELEEDIDFKTSNTEQKLTFTSTLLQRFGKRHSLKTGVIVNIPQYNLQQYNRDNRQAPLELVIRQNGNTQLLQAYTEWQGNIGSRLTLNTGVHYMQLLLNNTKAIEPRVALKWEAGPKGSITAGYGLHSQMQGLGVYFTRVTNAQGAVLQPNKNLGFTRAHHFVAGYQHQLGANLRVKTELYYQHLFNVPVGNHDTSIVSTLNLRDGFLTEALTNRGKGRNYGAELTLERNLDKNFYLMWSNSFYQSKYTPLDGKERNTRWNGNYATTLVAGKEWINTTKTRVFGLNLRTIYSGGFRYTPINAPLSEALGRTIYDEARAFELQHPAYFRTDLRISWQWNRTKRTNTLSLDIQNVTNRQNIFGEYFDHKTNQIKTIYQTGIIPVINYKVEI